MTLGNASLSTPAPRWRTGAPILLALVLGSVAHSAQPVLQRGYDANVSGSNLSEGTLNTSNVGLNTFGKIFALPVNDAVFAQPLYVPGVVIPGQGTHNVVYVATMSDTLYAFDADTGGAPLWSITFGTPVAIANWVFMNNQNIVGNLRDLEHAGDRSVHSNHVPH